MIARWNASARRSAIITRASSPVAGARARTVAREPVPAAVRNERVAKAGTAAVLAVAVVRADRGQETILKVLLPCA